MTIWAILSILTALFALGLILLGQNRKDTFRAFVAYQFIGIFLLILGTVSLDTSISRSLALQSISLLLRLGIVLTSISFLEIVLSLSKIKRFMFYFFNAISIVFMGQIYFRSPQITIILTVAVFLSSIALSFVKIKARSDSVARFSHGRLFVLFESRLRNFSQVCDRLIGPVIVEWLLMTFVAFVWTSLRILSRFFSYASLQRYFATSLLLLLLLLLLVLRP